MVSMAIFYVANCKRWPGRVCQVINPSELTDAKGARPLHPASQIAMIKIYHRNILLYIVYIYMYIYHKYNDMVINNYDHNIMII